jgi:hypothetical protein
MNESDELRVKPSFEHSLSSVDFGWVVSIIIIISRMCRTRQF